MKKKQIIILHISFWSLILFITGLQTIPSFGKIAVSLIIYDYLLYIASYVLIFYCFYIFISRKYHDKNKIILLVILGLLFTVIIDLPITYTYLYILSPDVLALQGNEFRITFSKYYMSFLETNFLFAVSGALLKTALHHYVNIMEQKEAEKQLILGDLALLKSQINPLFLFNTLANIKSLIEKKPEKAIYSIENLSEIMSYMLYDTSADKVLLDNEVANINNYLNLQRIRYSPDFIDFAVTGNTNGIYVPPLIFMPFIENAFKFADSESAVPGVIIKLDVSNNNLLFYVSNSVNKNVNQDNADDGFSINSIRRQLDLLFENKYKLEIVNESGMKTVRFSLGME